MQGQQEKITIDPEMMEKMDSQSIRTFGDIIRALISHPDWLMEIRKLILTTELMELPKKFQEFLEKEFRPLAQRVEKLEQEVSVIKQDVEILKGDVAVLKQDVKILKQDVATLKQDVEILKQDVEILKQDVEILKQDVATLKQDVEILKQDVATLKQDVEILKRDVATLKQDVEILKQDVATLKQDVEILKQDVAVLKVEVASLRGDVNYLKGEFGRFKGREFQRTVREKIYSFLGRLLKRTKLINFEDLADRIDTAEEQGLITEEERIQALEIDIVVKGIIKQTGKPVILAGEISYAAYEDDVERAVTRSNILFKVLGEEVIPVIICADGSTSVESMAEEKGALVVRVNYD